MLYFYLLCTKTKDKYKYKAISIKIHTNHKYIKRKGTETQSFLFYEHGIIRKLIKLKQVTKETTFCLFCDFRVQINTLIY